MSMLKAKPTSQKRPQSAPRHKPESTAFDVPPDYRDHTLRRLRETYNGDWWLNVDYVVRH